MLHQPAEIIFDRPCRPLQRVFLSQNAAKVYNVAMVEPLKPWEIVAYEQAQRATIFRRQEFLQLNDLTQLKVISLLERMDEIIQKKSEVDAQKYFFREIFKHWDRRHGWKEDRSGIDWSAVENQIKNSCFSDHDMEGLRLHKRRVASELSAFRDLTQLGKENPDIRQDF